MASKKKSKKKVKARPRTSKGIWSAADVQLLRKKFPDNPTDKIAKELGRNTDAVKKKAARMGIRKSKRYLRKLGRA